ncbi:hypothetical protein [Salinisphaera sp. T31B1]|uniref:hypothetical protein n=1 Tax=Salinisphaera sp. T31B1 TaxID=727963 RepID=UPI00333F35FF
MTTISIFLTCLHLTTTHPFELVTFERLVNFNAVEPFQHRVLLPAIVAGIQHFLPLGEKLLFGMLEVFGWIALIVLSHRALVMFNIGRDDLMRRVLAITVVIPMAMHLIAPDLQLASAFVAEDQRLDLGTWHPVPLFYYVYDLPAAVFTLGMGLLLIGHVQAPRRGLMLAYLLVFALATVNRETTVFMLGFFALLFAGRMPWSRLALLLGIQLLIFVTIQWPLNWLFADQVNPNAQLAGTQYENHLWENLGLLTSPLYLIIFVARFAAGLHLPVLMWHRWLDVRLVAALIGFSLPLIGFALLAGRVQEQRIFIETVPLIWLAALQVIAARSEAGDRRPNAATATAPLGTRQTLVPEAEPATMSSRRKPTGAEGACNRQPD